MHPPSPGPVADARPASLLGTSLGLLAAAVIGPPLRALPAGPQPPGYAALHGLDAGRDVLLFFLTITLALAGGIAGARRARASSRREIPTTPFALPPTLALAAVCAHALAVWIFLIAGFSSRSASFLLALAVLASAGLASALGVGSICRGALFLGAASPVLALAFTGRRPLPFAASAAAATILLPCLAAFLRRGRSRPPWVLRFLIVGALLPGSFTALAAAAVLGAPLTADIFEDGHALLPASEYLRGELPYRDVVPGHGLLSDGLFHAAGLDLFGDDYRGYVRANKLLGALFWPGFYAIGYAATGNPAAGFGALALSFVCFPQYAFPRAIASLAVLALALFASRTGALWGWRACGAMGIVSLCVSVDFALYAAAAAATALQVAKANRREQAWALLSGAALAATVLATALVAAGILGDFLHTTFRMIPSLFPVYAQGLPELVAANGGFLAGYANRLTLLYLVVLAALVLLGAELPRGSRVSEGARSVLPVLTWIVLAVLSVLERQHVGYPFFAVPTALLLLARWFRASGGARRLRTAIAAAALLGLAGMGNPPLLAAAIANAVRHPAPPPDTAPLLEPRRARGAVFRRDDRILVARTADLLRRADFRDGDTWLDFANAPGLYFLFDRPCPIRYYEVPFYESVAGQREVIDAVARNPRVRAVLMRAIYPPIDGVPNAVRAPLVARYLRARFRPFFSEDGVEFWLRKP